MQALRKHNKAKATQTRPTKQTANTNITNAVTQGNTTKQNKHLSSKQNVNQHITLQIIQPQQVSITHKPEA